MAPAEAELRRALFGRRQGRKLRPAQRELLETWLPRLRLEIPPPPEPLDLDHVFAAPKGDCWLEIGFGGGEHLAWQAARHPDIGFIGCEPFVNGLVSLLAKVREGRLRNVRVVDDDARVLLGALPEASIGRAFILFPDPWPKKRHHKRRIVQAATLERLAAILKDGAELRLSSDDPGYVRWMLRHGLDHPDFEWLAETASDWRQRPADWPGTRYEAKAARAARDCFFLRFRRRPRPPKSHETS
jgi:tRNA (guanine-N7-)-methyltransferase